MENSNNQTNNSQQAPPPLGEFFQWLESNGRHGDGFGVDRSSDEPQFPPGFGVNPAQFAPWASWGSWNGPWTGQRGRRGGWHGRHHHYRDEHDSENEDQPLEQETESPDTVRETPDGPQGHGHDTAPPQPPPPPGVPHHQHGPPPGFGPHRRHGGRCGRGGRGGRRHGPAPPPAYEGPFDFRPLMNAFAAHPFAQTFRDYLDQARAAVPQPQNDQQDQSFSPPVDIFNTEKAYVLHVSLPGAAKEDIGVNWDGEKVNIAGVVYRPGDEEFLKTLSTSERKVGMFERSVPLPPPGSDDKEDIDGFSITAKMENGILVVTVPKTEKEWTEIHKIDIE